MVALNSSVVQDFLLHNAEWELDTQTHELKRVFTFRTYDAGVMFVNKVAKVAQKQNHHPKIVLEWGRVTIATTTHDAGNTITEKDIQLAKAIDEL